MLLDHTSDNPKFSSFKILYLNSRIPQSRMNKLCYGSKVVFLVITTLNLADFSIRIFLTVCLLGGARKVEGNIEHVVFLLVLLPQINHSHDFLWIFIAEIIDFCRIFFQIVQLPFPFAKGWRHPQDFPLSVE